MGNACTGLFPRESIAFLGVSKLGVFSVLHISWRGVKRRNRAFVNRFDGEKKTLTVRCKGILFHLDGGFSKLRNKNMRTQAVARRRSPHGLGGREGASVFGDALPAATHKIKIHRPPSATLPEQRLEPANFTIVGNFKEIRRISLWKLTCCFCCTSQRMGRSQKQKTKKNNTVLPIYTN